MSKTKLLHQNFLLTFQKSLISNIFLDPKEGVHPPPLSPPMRMYDWKYLKYLQLEFRFPFRTLFRVPVPVPHFTQRSGSRSGLYSAFRFLFRILPSVPVPVPHSIPRSGSCSAFYPAFRFPFRTLFRVPVPVPVPANTNALPIYLSCLKIRTNSYSKYCQFGLYG